MYLVVRPMENCIEEGEFTPRYPHAAENFWYNQQKKPTAQSDEWMAGALFSSGDVSTDFDTA